jgi:hypothetical protein
MPRIRKEILMEKPTKQDELLIEVGRMVLIKEITSRLNKCDDISLLDLILRLLKKSK